MSKIKITISGGFHNMPERNFIIKNNRLSIRQWQNIHKHMCTYNGCQCGYRDWDVQGMSFDALLDLIRDADCRYYHGER